MPLDQEQVDVDEPLFGGGDGDAPMPLGDHLEELRRRVIWALVGVFAVFFVMVLPPVATRLISWIAGPLVTAMYATGYPPQTFVTDPSAGFTTVYLPVSFIGALIVSSPWVLWQVWRFISVGLYANERQAVHILVPFSTLMTALGVGFTYYVMLPVALMFFLNFARVYPTVEPGDPGPVMSVLLERVYGMEPRSTTAAVDPGDAVIPVFPVLTGDPDPLVEGMVWMDAKSRSVRTVIGGRTRDLAMASTQLMTPLPKLDEYVRFASFMGLGVVAAFQLPVLMLVLGWSGLVDPDFLAKGRKYALFVCVCLGGVLTPTDIVSMAVLSVPLYGLFELGLVLMRMATRQRGEAASDP